MQIINRNIRIKLEDNSIIWNKLNNKIVVTKEVIVPGANLIVPRPKKVTNKKLIFLIIFNN